MSCDRYIGQRCTWLIRDSPQQAGGIAGAALVEGLTPRSTSDVGSTITTLSTGMTLVRGLFLEAFLTAMLVFVILMLAAEKHKVRMRICCAGRMFEAFYTSVFPQATFLAPIGIGLTLFVCQLFGTLWTGCEWPSLEITAKVS